MAIYNDKTGVTLLDSQVPFVTGILPRKLEKQYMNPARYRINYWIVPGYLIFCTLCILVSVTLLEYDEKRFMPVFIGLFLLMGVVSAILLMTVPKTRKRELTFEGNRYDFDGSSVAKQERYVVEYEGTELVLSSNGMTLEGKFYWYSHLKPRLVTSNRFNRVWVAIMFGEDPVNALFVPVSPVLIRAVQDLNIPVQNRSAFDYLLTHKENAFSQIYKYGNFQVFE